MGNELYIPRTNPVQFFQVNPVVNPQYHTKRFDDYRFQETIKSWEYPVCHTQKFQNNDPVYLQFVANFTGIEITVTNGFGRVFSTVSAVPKLQSVEMPGYWAQEATVLFTGLPEGLYVLRLMFAGAELYVSETLNIREDWPDTLWYAYHCLNFHNDVIWKTGIVMGIRLDGSIGRVEPSSIEQYYNDQKLNRYLLNSRTFNKFQVNVGGNKGAPDWVFDKLNLIWSNSHVALDGVYYAKVAEGDFDYHEEEGYVLRSVNMLVAEGLNRLSKIFAPELNPQDHLTVLYNIRTSAIFGNMPTATGDTIVIRSTD